MTVVSVCVEMAFFSKRRALPGYQSKEMKILNISFPRVGIKLPTFRVYSRTHVPQHHYGYFYNFSAY